MLLPALNLPGKLAQSVREALASLGFDATRIAPMPAWTEHIHTLAPSPADSSSLYREHANWMKALSELNRRRYDALFARWHTANPSRNLRIAFNASETEVVQSHTRQGLSEGEPILRRNNHSLTSHFRRYAL